MTAGIRLDEFVPIENISASFDGRLVTVTKAVEGQAFGKITWNAEIEMAVGLSDLAAAARITVKF